MSGPVLIVDDNFVNLQLARLTLEIEGFEVVCASDADTARAAITARRPALILMDIQLPGTDGLTLTREIKADPATRAIPVVALTAYAMVGDEQRALAAGCDSYVAKPITVDELPRIVGSFVGRPS